jgi:hypothetical protein
MTAIVFAVIGFLSCWFLLYALMHWVQDGRGKKYRSAAELEEKDLRKQERVIKFKEKPSTTRERRV